MNQISCWVGIVIFCWTHLDSTATLDCSYGDALHKSLLFFEAQRSGALPNNNRIPWRGDSALNDAAGLDLKGGYYTNFGFIKNSFPLAFTSTMVSWGVIQYKEQYQQSSEYDNVLHSLKWGLDYLLKSRDGTTFHVQVGDVNNDYSTWGRPEDIDAKVTSTSWDKWLRPVGSVDLTSQGTDLAAQVVAALASGYMVFSNSNQNYANSLLAEAVTIYNYAYNNPNKKNYGSTVNAGGVYGSNWDYNDDLTWAGLWMYYATSDNTYLTKATSTYNNHQANEFYYNDLRAGNQLLMYYLDDNTNAKDAFKTFLQRWFPATAQVTYTPKGLAWSSNTFPLAKSANVAFLALIAADFNIFPTDGRAFASTQIGYMLGAQGMSYLVGCGSNYPTKIKHKASSCPSLPTTCDWSSFNNMGNNPQILEGALISGPGSNDVLQATQYSDERLVALDYNGGFQSALVGLMALGDTVPTPATSTPSETTTTTTTTTNSPPLTTTTTPPAQTTTTTNSPPSTTTTTPPTQTTAQQTTTTTTTGGETTTTTTSSGSTTTSSASACASSGDYNYREVLEKSILFYEAQRSGKLPPTNRIPWRGDSALTDGQDVNKDLTGGWYDAGDHVKFGFPMAFSVATLAWGLHVFKDGYQAAGQYEQMLDSIKWPLDYFIKAHTATNEFYGQVGHGGNDHSYWGRPEDMTMPRPSYKIDLNNPGADLAGQTAAALAAGAVVFKDYDSVYANTLLSHAEELYDLAVSNGGSKYSDTITDASGYYRSNHVYDEVAWAALWLYLATNDVTYKNEAISLYNSQGLGSQTAWAFDWDNKHVAVQLMLYSIEGSTTYKTAVENFLSDWSPSGSLHYTPKGLAWRMQWGPLRLSANAALIALIAAKEGIKPVENQNWARGQIHYALGSTGRSFVVGFGVNPPQRPHHRAASCPSDLNAPCGWDQYNTNAPNGNILNGALVGGPDGNDNYVDDRKDYISNEVACDYNAGFQGAIAGLIALDCEN